MSVDPICVINIRNSKFVSISNVLLYIDSFIAKLHVCALCKTFVIRELCLQRNNNGFTLLNPKCPC